MIKVELVHRQVYESLDVQINNVIRKFESQGYVVEEIKQLQDGNFLIVFFKEE